MNEISSSYNSEIVIFLNWHSYSYSFFSFFRCIPLGVRYSRSHYYIAVRTRLVLLRSLCFLRAPNLFPGIRAILLEPRGLFPAASFLHIRSSLY